MININSIIFLLPFIFLIQHSTSWVSPIARGNLWQRDPFLLPEQSIKEQPFIPQQHATPPFFKPGFNSQQMGVNTSIMSSKMFNTYFEKNNISDMEDELEYYRHDLGVNLFHFYWHSVNPFDGIYVKNHRRGESFYYMHQQMLARYNVERIANGESQIRSIHDEVELESKIEEKYELPGYDAVSFDSQCTSSYKKMQEWTNNIIDAINKGYAEDTDGTHVPISVDLLGNMIQPSSASPNTAKYGSSHNMGHYSIAYCHYVGDQKLKIPILGDLGDTRTAPRCPVFYRFHTFIDDIFKIFLNMLPEYKKVDLHFPDIKIESIKTISETGKINQLETFWQQIIMDSFYERDYLTQEYDQPTHIQHDDFRYEIIVDNHDSQPKQGTVRIFIAPKYDKNGKPYSLSAQRSLFIELDKFSVDLHPGRNTINRSAEDSVITVNFDTLFRYLAKGKTNKDGEAQVYCMCGWPDYYLLPRGTEEGMVFQLFVMVSDNSKDAVNNNIIFEQPNPGKINDLKCKQAYSYCGKMESVYPDNAPMGFPWDRPAPKWATTLDTFCTSNMLYEDLLITHVDKVIESIPDVQYPTSKAIQYY